MIDFGDDELTQGRAHPMIDSTLRVERFSQEINDPSCGVVLLDVVLGHAADPAPALALAPVITAATEQDVAVVVSLIGSAATRRDSSRPRSNCSPPVPTCISERGRRSRGNRTGEEEAMMRLDEPPAVATAGPSRFADALIAQAAEVTALQW